MTLPRPSSPPHNSDTASRSQGANGTNGHQSGLATRDADFAPAASRDLAPRDVNWSDPQTRALLDQIVVALQTDAAGSPAPTRPASARYGAIVRRRWKPMLLAFALGLGLVGWRLRPQEDTYTARAQMLLPQSSSSSAGGAAPADLITAGRAFDQRGSVDTQMAIITSPTMIKTALASLPADLRTRGWAAPDNTEEERAKRREMLKPGATAIWTAWWDPKWGLPVGADVPVTALDSVSNDVIDISATSQDPDASIQLANRMVATYANSVAKNSNVNIKKSLDFVTKQLALRNRELDDAKIALRAYQEKVGIADISQEQNLITSQVASLRGLVNAAQDELRAGVGSNAVQQDGVLTSLQTHTNELQTNYEDVRRTFRPNAPEAQAAERQYLNAKRQSDGRLKDLLTSLQERANNANQAYNAAVTRAAQLPRIKFDIGQLQGKIDGLQTGVQGLSKQQSDFQIRVEQAASTPTNLAPAVAASVSARTWSRVGGMALVAGLMLAVLMASLLEALDHSLHGADDVESIPGASMLGALPLLKGRTPRNLGILGDAAHAALDAPDLLELCRILRSNLTFASPDAPLHSVLVTSADAGEGKSLCACNLAAVMAFDGRRVLLLDGDLRRPTQHRLAGADLGFGWADLLNSGAALNDVIRATPTANLSLITAGTPTPNPTELLNSPRAREFFEELQHRFDVIIVDSPPALALADAQLWASLCDATILVAGANRTQRSRLLRAQSLLRHAGGRVLGIVLNRVRSRADLGVGGYGSEYAGANARFKVPAPALPASRN